MIEILIGVALLFVVLGLMKGVTGTPPEKLARILRILGGVAVAIFALFMIEKGRFFLAIPALLVALGLVRGWLWRRAAKGPAQAGSVHTAQMSVAEAYDVLGLEPGATRAEIKAAHHRLIAKTHPDHGGTDYLAVKINQAKDLLLKTKN